MGGLGLLPCKPAPNPISPVANPCCNLNLKVGVVLSLGWAMRRRSRASSKSAKTRRRKPKTLKAARRGSPSTFGRETAVVRLTRDLNEVRELQAATAEVLRVISTSPHDIQPVFDTIAENAARICQGRFAFVVRF